MKKFIASAIIVVTILFICVGIYNFPKGNNPIFSSNLSKFSFSIDISEIVHRFNSEYNYKWSAAHYKNASKKVSFNENSDWNFYIGREEYIWNKKCTCSYPEKKYAPWGKYPEEIHPKWEIPNN